LSRGLKRVRILLAHQRPCCTAERACGLKCLPQPVVRFLPRPPSTLCPPRGLPSTGRYFAEATARGFATKTGGATPQQFLQLRLVFGEGHRRWVDDVVKLRENCPRLLGAHNSRPLCQLDDVARPRIEYPPHPRPQPSPPL